jgi:histidinol-phosphate aminotransferase
VSTAAETTRYPDNGAAVLTRALADRYDVTPGQVALGSGAVTVLQQLAQAYIEPGSAIAFGWRSFEMYPLLAQVAGGHTQQVPLVPGAPGGTADTFDLPALAAAIDDTTRLVFVCNPNNPTGTAVRRAASWTRSPPTPSSSWTRRTASSSPTPRCPTASS